MLQKTVVNGWHIHFFHVTLPSQEEKNMLWIIHGHHRIFVKKSPRNFPRKLPHTFISSRGVLSIVTHQMLGFLVFGLGRRRNSPDNSPPGICIHLPWSKFFVYPPPIKGAKRGKSTKVPLTRGFKLGLCGMVSSFFAGGVCGPGCLKSHLFLKFLLLLADLGTPNHHPVLEEGQEILADPGGFGQIRTVCSVLESKPEDKFLVQKSLNLKPAIVWKGFGIFSVWWKAKIGTRNRR